MLTPLLDSQVVQSAGSRSIHLCSDGRFIRTIRLHPVLGQTTEGQEGVYHETGTWLIEMQGSKVTLVLTKSSGGTDSHEVLDQGEQFLLDGQDAAVRVSSHCL